MTESRGGGGGKTKNSTNRDHVSLSKSIQKMAKSLETAGGGESGMMILMLSMQMQQQTQQIAMQQQMFL